MLEIIDACVNYIEALQEQLVDVQDMCWRLRLKQTVDNVWRQCFEQPSEKIPYGLWDHMAPLQTLQFQGLGVMSGRQN